MNKRRRVAEVKHRQRLKKREEKKKAQQPVTPGESAKPAKKGASTNK